METNQLDNLIDFSLILVFAFRDALSYIRGVSILSYRPPEDKPRLFHLRMAQPFFPPRSTGNLNFTALIHSV